MNRHPFSPSCGRAGITLLEVLVACGILVVGLASLASVLPAAGSRLAQATVEDRAGGAAANAYTECVARGLVASDLFVSSTTACAFGRGLENIVPDIVSPKRRRGKNKMAASSAITQANAVLLDRIDDVRGFSLEDDLSFLPSTATDTPVNAFVTTGTLATGNRLSRSGVCWGAMLAATSGTAVAGAEATLSVAVFRKEVDETATLALARQSGSLFRITSVATVTTSGTVTDPSPAAAVAARKQFMPGCGYVIAVPTAGPAMPKWVRVMSSWTDAADLAYVALDLDGLGDAASQTNYLNGTTLTVIGFENLVRVDQYTVTLD
jgi:type II secretory pathway pseudopilin PulG